MQRRLLLAMLRGLHFMHSANISHRDIKPANFLVSRNCSFLIGDLGHSRSELHGGGGRSWPAYDSIPIGLYARGGEAKRCLPPELISIRAVRSWHPSTEIWMAACAFLRLVRGRFLFFSSSARLRAREVVKLFGTPPREAVRQYAQEVWQFFPEAIRRPASPWRVFKGVDARLVRVLQPMLDLNPAARASAWEALQDPIFDGWRDTLTDAPRHIAREVEDLATAANNTASLRQLLWDEVSRHQRSR
uniref:Mitogen-activated protein kinase 19-like n=1 Tax=Tetraselmis sp. GSL018 TaxID=582737 RepID=A0A061QP02_9CHLO|mmetsp:Transcript_7749/g.18554  ORF Transcript_7749/g.18554 Transcript_7749/m.18554 type:complete len:246 (-) Transcript_7749:170-907(-)